MPKNFFNAILLRAPFKAFACTLFLTLIAAMLWPNTASAQSRIFPLHLQNGTDQTVTFTVYGGFCWEGTPRSGVVGTAASGERVTLTIARVQGFPCDGRQGFVAIEPSTFPGELQWFWFSNDGGLAPISISNDYHGVLSPKSAVDESYTWTLRDLNERLSGPPDERLHYPRNHVAYDSGDWTFVRGASTSTVDSLRFANTSASWGSYYFSCSGIETFHPQHIKRLANKNGRAYFMAAQSRAHNGWIFLMETDLGVLDPETDLLRPSTDGSPVGKIIWQDLYTGSFNGNINPVGNWNHPAKMTLQGGVLIVVAQNWSDGAGIDGCTHSTSNPYQRGDSEDALLFYDVRDPQYPKYWGKMTATDLRIPKTEYLNGTDGSGRGGYARQIDVVSLVRSTTKDEWTLNAGSGDGYTTWTTNFVSPDIKHWLHIGGAGTDKPYQYVSGQHGDDFSSYQWIGGVGDKRGVERIMTFNVKNIGAGGGEADGFAFGGVGDPGRARFNMGLPGADRHWATESLYVTRDGMPIAYSIESSSGPDGNRGGRDAYLYQVSDTRNLPANQTPRPVTSVVTNTNDGGAGSLRRAIGYGGKITFDPSLNGQTITLRRGPLIVYVADVEIDASALPDGITISGNDASRVMQIEPGNKVVLNGVSIKGGYAKRLDYVRWSGSGGGIFNQGDLTILNSTIASNRADSSGGGIASFEGSALIVNSTIAQNQSTNAYGGGIATDADMLLRHTTVAENSGVSFAGGIVHIIEGKLTLENSIVADNTTNGQPADLAGDYATVGANIVEAMVSGQNIGTGPTPIAVDPFLQELGDYGGPTQTMPPLAGSAALDRASNSGLATDQRLQARPIGTAPDLGAVETLFANPSPADSQQYVALTGTTLTWANVPC